MKPDDSRLDAKSAFAPGDTLLVGSGDDEIQVLDCQPCPTGGFSLLYWDPKRNFRGLTHSDHVRRPPGTLPVSIYVVADADGRWQAFGWNGLTERQALAEVAEWVFATAAQPVGHAQLFEITAELPRTIERVAGTVVPLPIRSEA